MKRGTRVGQAYVALTVDGSGINEDIRDSVNESEDELGDSGERGGGRWRDRFSREAFGKKWDDIRERAGGKLRESLGEAGDDAAKDFTKKFGNNIDGDILERIGDRLGANFAGHMLDALNHAFGDADTNHLGALFEKLMTEAETAGTRGGRSVSGNKGLGDRLFGGTYRNNAINLLAKSLAGLTNLTESAVNGITGLFKSVAEGAAEGEQGATFMEKLSAGASELAASGPAAAAAIVAVGVAMTFLVSIANALLAIVVALAATITSALVGALAVGAAGLTAVAAAAGLGVLAFMSMTDAQKHLLSEGFKPLHEEAIGLGQVMLHDLIPAFDTWSRNLQIALAYAKPLADVMGGALAEAGSVFSASLSGPGVQLFITSLSTVLLPLLFNLSAAMGGFLNGTLALFAAVLPMVLRFSIYLNKVATSFSAWATSAKGQNAITDFVNRALDSLNSLWNFIKAIGGLIAAVLFSPSGQQTGNNIFDRMTKAVQRFTNYLQQDDRLDKWFKQGEEFAIALGNAIKLIGKILQSLNQSGVIDGISRLVDIAVSSYDAFKKLPRVIEDLVFPLQGVSDLIGYIGDGISGLSNLMDELTGKSVNVLELIRQTIADATNQSALDTLLNPGGAYTQPDATAPTTTATATATPTLQDLMDQLQHSGADALAQTNLPPKGQLSDAQLAQYQALADSLIKNGPTVVQQIKQALANIGKTITKVVSDANASLAAGLETAAQSLDAGEVASSLQGLIDSQTSTLQSTIQKLKSNGAALVTAAQDSLNAAAQNLASATTQKEANAALAAIAKAEKQLKKARKAQAQINVEAQALQDSINAGTKIVKAQEVFTQANADLLANGFAAVNATLADYADARAQVAKKLEDANTALDAAISLRDTYKQSISSAVESFAALTTAQAQTINGVAQALTSNDITTNLQTKLDQIKTFQANLNTLLARGLSQNAYKQLLDAGVEQGGAYAAALVGGGSGAVQSVNSLTQQISDTAAALGLQASNRLYQAGVDAAQGLVDGLTSLSAELDSAATKLGESIAAALKDALGIHSPSTVMFDAMYTGVGDGLVGGLDATHSKVGHAVGRLSDKIAVSPEVAAWAASQGRSPVSGNQDPRFRDLIVNTPTEDPEAVAYEVLNEVTGRLP